jgi:hypothetical protein
MRRRSQLAASALVLGLALLMGQGEALAASGGHLQPTATTSSYHCSATTAGSLTGSWFQSCVVVNGSYWQAVVILTVTGNGLTYQVRATAIELAGSHAQWECDTAIGSAQSYTCFGATHSAPSSTVRSAADVAWNGSTQVDVMSPSVGTS